MNPNSLSIEMEIHIHIKPLMDPIHFFYHPFTHLVFFLCLDYFPPSSVQVYGIQISNNTKIHKIKQTSRQL